MRSMSGTSVRVFATACCDTKWSRGKDGGMCGGGTYRDVWWGTLMCDGAHNSGLQQCFHIKRGSVLMWCTGYIIQYECRTI